MTQPPPPPPPSPPPLPEHPAGRGPRLRRQRSLAVFMGGIVAGLLISLVYYQWLGTAVAEHTPWAPLGAVVFKLAAGLTMAVIPRTRDFGEGLVMSIPVGVLIFLGLCFAAIAN